MVDGGQLLAHADKIDVLHVGVEIPTVEQVVGLLGTYNGRVCISSVVLALLLEHRHFAVLERIRNVKCSKGFRQENLVLLHYRDRLDRLRPHYAITIAGFVLLRSDKTKNQPLQDLILKALIEKEKSFAVKDKCCVAGSKIPEANGNQPVIICDSPIVNFYDTLKGRGKKIHGAWRGLFDKNTVAEEVKDTPQVSVLTQLNNAEDRNECSVTHGEQHDTDLSANRTSHDTNLLLLAQAVIESQRIIKEQGGQIEELTDHIEADKLKVDYYDALVDRKGSQSFRDTAKEFGVALKSFVSFLINAGYLYRDHRNELMPCPKPLADGLFVIKEWVNQNNKVKGVQTLVTPYGRERLRRIMYCQFD
jgi:phage antirepressor YoqD-like protein